MSVSSSIVLLAGVCTQVRSPFYPSNPSSTPHFPDAGVCICSSANVVFGGLARMDGADAVARVAHARPHYRDLP